jgi:hypothetical protein
LAPNPIATEAAETGLPKESVTLTAGAGAIGLPALALLGWLTKATVFADPGLIVTPWEALFSDPEEPVIVGVPTFVSP